MYAETGILLNPIRTIILTVPRDLALVCVLLSRIIACKIHKVHNSQIQAFTIFNLLPCCSLVLQCKVPDVIFI